MATIADYNRLQQLRAGAAAEVGVNLTNVLANGENLSRKVLKKPSVLKYHPGRDIQKSLALTDPSLLKLTQKDNHRTWKMEGYFTTGRKVKEGKKLYLKTNFEGKTGNPHPEHKDFTKAWILYTTLPAIYKERDEYKQANVFTSKKFSKVMFGKIQKSHKMQKKRHRKAAKRAAAAAK